MSNVKKIKVGSTSYDCKDATARTQVERINLTNSGDNLVFTDANGNTSVLPLSGSGLKGKTIKLYGYASAGGGITTLNALCYFPAELFNDVSTITVSECTSSTKVIVTQGSTTILNRVGNGSYNVNFSGSNQVVIEAVTSASIGNDGFRSAVITFS